MNIYKGIKYYRTWMRGNWFLILPDFQISVQLVDGCTDDDIINIINNEVIKYV